MPSLKSLIVGGWLAGAALAAPLDPTFGEDPAAPTQVTGEMICEACHGVLGTVQLKLDEAPGAVTEIDVYDALDGVCDEDNFRSHRFIPPAMVDACEAFLNVHGSQLETQVSELGARAKGEVCDAVCSHHEHEYKHHDDHEAEALEKLKNHRKDRRQRLKKHRKQAAKLAAHADGAEL